MNPDKITNTTQLTSNYLNPINQDMKKRKESESITPY